MTDELVREIAFPRVCESGTEASKQTFEKLTITFKKKIKNSERKQSMLKEIRIHSLKRHL